MLDYLQQWISKGEMSGYTTEELAMHTRHSNYFLAGIAICVALLIVQYGEVKKQDMK